MFFGKGLSVSWLLIFVAVVGVTCSAEDASKDTFALVSNDGLQSLGTALGTARRHVTVGSHGGRRLMFARGGREIEINSEEEFNKQITSNPGKTVRMSVSLVFPPCLCLCLCLFQSVCACSSLSVPAYSYVCVCLAWSPCLVWERVCPAVFDRP